MQNPDQIQRADELFTAQPAARALIGQTLGHHRILSLLGKGGMGEVYLAEDTALGRRVAFKLLPEQFTTDADRLRRFKQEARAASALNHPNIVTIHEISQAEGLHFIITEHINGVTLRERIAGGKIELKEALEIVSQMASGLAVAHEAGIVHRDIKPENVMLRRDGVVKVLDFGLAKLTETRKAERGTRNEEAETLLQDDPNLPRSSFSPHHSTEPGIVMGTPQYMSPEQVRGLEVDARTDIFSLGVVLYELITGQSPFAGTTTADVMAAVLRTEPAPLQRFVREAPAELERIVTKALQKDREQRSQSVKDLLLDLKNLKLELEVEARLKRVAPPVAQPEIPPAAQPAEEPPTLLQPPSSRSTALRVLLEPVGGAVPLDSKFYLVRPTDEKFRTAIARQDSIVLVKGARQVGKTSLLARGLQQARAAGAKVVLTDFQNLNADDLESADKLLLSFADAFTDQLDLDVSPKQLWQAERSPSIKFEQFLRREVLRNLSAPLVWGLDEVDRLFTCNYGSEVFGLFRSWHNKRALDPTGPWRNLTLAIAYATEAHLFITDLNQSPFNVGTRLLLEDFNFEQVEELNARYGSPLSNQAEVAHFFRLLSGHPYLVRRGMYEMVSENCTLAALAAQADRDEGPFGDHLHRIVVSLAQDAALCNVVRGMLQGRPCATPESFYRLRSAGLAIGDSVRDARLRCQLYTTYLEKHLL